MRGIFWISEKEEKSWQERREAHSTEEWRPPRIYQFSNECFAKESESQCRAYALIPLSELETIEHSLKTAAGVLNKAKVMSDINYRGDNGIARNQEDDG